MTDIAFRFSSPAEGDFFCKKQSAEGDIFLYRIRMAWRETRVPLTTVLRFKLPGTDAYSVFDCRRFDRAKSWGGVERTSRLAADLPLLQLISKNGNNRYLLTLSDVKTPVRLKISCDYNDMTAAVEVFFFTELTAPADRYECLLRIDARPVPFTEALTDAKRWFASLGYAPAKTPAAAFDPVYSTWYSYLTRVTAADVLRECRTAKQYGMDTIIIDDGWQRENGASVYGYTGDWEPYSDKFPDMAGLIRTLHDMGMKAMVWYSVPYVGHFSKNYARFQGKYLTEVAGCDCAVLDPRYPEVRSFLVDAYTEAVKQWRPDGLKLDFIDRFRSNGEVKEGMDLVSVEDATHLLLRQVYSALTALNQEMLIEFRQPYSGPVIGAFGNLIRVWDCPNDGMTNRVSSLNLRLTTDAAVHSDPIRWGPDETPEQTAALLWGTLFSVPQISVRLAELTGEQRAVLRRYLSFWRAHRETLMRGRLTVQSPDCMFSCAAAEKDGERIVLCAAQNFVDVSDVSRAYVCNLTQAPRIIIKAAPGTEVRAMDCFGKPIFTNTAQCELTEVPVPLGGMIATNQEKS